MKYPLSFWTVLVAIITTGAIVVFTVTIVHALWYAPDIEAEVPLEMLHAVVESDDQPRFLSIPSLGIDAAIQQVGINAKGNMAVPSNFQDVAWYKYGPVPGDLGSAVIDGHVDNGLGMSGVFKRLHEINVGDDVYISTESGEQLHFEVKKVETYPYDEVPTERLFDQNKGIRLNLVTCEGKWVRADKTYDQRLVVYTELKQ